MSRVNSSSSIFAQDFDGGELGLALRALGASLFSPIFFGNFDGGEIGFDLRISRVKSLADTTVVAGSMLGTTPISDKSPWNNSRDLSREKFLRTKFRPLLDRRVHSASSV